MHNLGFKEVVINGFSTTVEDINKLGGPVVTVKNGTDSITIVGYGTIHKDNIDSVVITKPSEAVAGKLDVQVDAGVGAAAAGVQFTVFADTLRNHADAHRNYVKFGSRFSFQANVAANATATAVATAVEDAINAHDTRWGDLPFTVARTTDTLTLTAKAGKEEYNFTVANFDYADKVGDNASITQDVAYTETQTLGFEGVGQPHQIEQNVSMLNGALDGYAHSNKAGHRVNLQSQYLQVEITQKVDKDVHVSSAFAGHTDLKGQFVFTMYVAEDAATGTSWTDLEGVVDASSATLDIKKSVTPTDFVAGVATDIGWTV